MVEKAQVIRGGKLVDGTGNAPVENGVVVIEGDRIKAIGEASKIEIPPDADVIDATAKTVMPGFIDAHLHFLGITSPNQATWVIDSPHVRSMRAVMDAWRVIDLSPHGESARELEIYVKKAGLSPMEAIVCATRNNAEVLGLQDEIGTLEIGRLADRIVVEGDPLRDITVLRDKKNITTILKGGEAVPRLPA